MFAMSYSITNSFFDRPKVKALMDRKTNKLLNHAGGFVRTWARRSMRPGGKSGKSSIAPDPPRYHSKDKVVTLRNILYGYDPIKQNVIVGPIKLNQKHDYGGVLVAGTIPALHEFGGTVGFREKQVGGLWRSVGRRKPRPGQRTRVRRATYPARPYMQPALEAARDNFPTLWYGSSADAA